MLTTSMNHAERMIVAALQTLTVAYGSPIGTQSLRIYFDGEADPQGETKPWGRLVSIRGGEIRGNSGRAAEGSDQPITVTVNLTSPDAVTVQNLFAIGMAVDAVAQRLRQSFSRVPASGQTQWIRFDSVQTELDPNPDQSQRERTGFVLASGILTRNTN